MITSLVILLAIFLAGSLAFLATLEVSLGQVNKLSVRLLAEKQSSRSAKLLKQLVDERWHTVFSLQGGMHLCSVLLAIVVTLYLHSQFNNFLASLLLTFGLMFLVILVFRQLIPGIISLTIHEKALLAMVPVYHYLRPVLNMLSFPMSSTWKYLAQNKESETGDEDDSASEEEIQAFIEVGTEEGILKSEEGELIQSVVEFGDKMARDIMTPRTDMVSIGIHATPAELKKLMQETKYSRIPVFQEQGENIQGIVFLKDLVEIWDQADHLSTIESLVRPIHFVPESKGLGELLKELQRQAAHMAIVVDEFGGIAGLVTIEDLLEEIAGEIHDEDEVLELRKIVKLDASKYLVPGSTAIGEVEELFALEISDEDSNTIAGFVNSHFGRVPHRGEKFSYGKLTFEVTEANQQRVSQLMISVEP
jgi:putative hemolysin